MKLHLVQKHKWFDMSKSGEKREEYRRMCQFWQKRIIDRKEDWTSVVFHRGYTKNTCEFEIDEICVAHGREEWGAEKGVFYFVIKLGKEINNQKL